MIGNHGKSLIIFINILILFSNGKELFIEVTQSTCDLITHSNCRMFHLIICHPPPSACSNVQFPDFDNCLEEIGSDWIAVQMQFSAGNNHTYKYKEITENIYVAAYELANVYSNSPVSILCQTSAQSHENTITLQDSTGQNTMTLRIKEIERKTSTVPFDAANLTTTETSNNSVPGVETTTSVQFTKSSSLLHNTLKTSSHESSTKLQDWEIALYVIVAIVATVVIVVVGVLLKKYVCKQNMSVGHSPPLIQGELEWEDPNTDATRPDIPDVEQQTVLIKNENSKSLGSPSSSDDKSGLHSEQASSKSDVHNEQPSSKSDVHSEQSSSKSDARRERPSSKSEVCDDENQDVHFMPTYSIENKNLNDETVQTKDEIARTEDSPRVLETTKTSDVTTDQDHKTREGDQRYKLTKENQNMNDERETNGTVSPFNETGEVEKGAEEDTTCQTLSENGKNTSLMNDVLTVPKNVKNNNEINQTNTNSMGSGDSINDDQVVAVHKSNKNTINYNGDDQVVDSDNTEQREATENTQAMTSTNENNRNESEINVEISTETTIPSMPGTAAEIPATRKQMRRPGTELDGENIRSDSYDRQMQKKIIATNSRIDGLDSKFENLNSVGQREADKFKHKYDKHKQKTKQKLKKLSDENGKLRKDLETSNKLSEARKQDIRRLEDRLKDIEKDMNDVKSRVLSNEQTLPIASQQDIVQIRKRVEDIGKKIIPKSMVKVQKKRGKKRR